MTKTKFNFIMITIGIISALICAGFVVVAVKVVKMVWNM